jgi:hypothetical protein
MSLLFQRTRQFPDRTVRCYLTLRCEANCGFCSAQIPQVAAERAAVEIPAPVWAEGLNRRARHTVLAGGEPFLYTGFAELLSLLTPTYKVEIYTNLQHDVDAFVEAAGHPYRILASLHPGTDLKAWYGRVKQLAEAGHQLRFHIVRSPGYEQLTAFLEEAGIVGNYSTALQGDQRGGPKSAGRQANRLHPLVKCSSRIFLFGPDGYRYHCVHQMTTGNEQARFEHINSFDGGDWTEVHCDEFGHCAGCDNNIEGKVNDVP